MAKQKEENTSGFENPEALVEGYSKFETWAANNKSKIGFGLFVLVAGVAALIWYMSSSSAEEKKSQEKIYTAQYYFGLDSLDLALEGDGDRVLGFQSIAKKYSGTKAGNLSNFYIGVIQLRKGNYQEALKALEEFSSDDYLLQGRAYALMGDAYMELEQYAKASEKYKDAADYNPNREFTPDYLMKLAASYEAQEKYADAKLEYDKLLKEYPQYRFKQEAQKYRAIAEGKSSKKG